METSKNKREKKRSVTLGAGVITARRSLEGTSLDFGERMDTCGGSVEVGAAAPATNLGMKRGRDHNPRDEVRIKL